MLLNHRARVPCFYQAKKVVLLSTTRHYQKLFNGNVVIAVLTFCQFTLIYKPKDLENGGFYTFPLFM